MAEKQHISREESHSDSIVIRQSTEMTIAKGVTSQLWLAMTLPHLARRAAKKLAEHP